MDIGLREWLAIIGVLVIVVIVIDGFRRYMGRSTLKFKLDRKLISQFSEEPANPEILGPVRVAEHREPVLGDEPDDLHDEPPVHEDVEPVQFDDAPLIEEPVEEESQISAAVQKENSTPEDEISEIFILYVESASPEGFKGPDLLQCVLESGMRFGEMDIFHRHESMSGTGDKLFSMANALKPGVFDLDNIDGFSTRSLCFFMSLPGPKQPKQAFELMLTAARKLADELDGEIKDDHRSDLTGQTVEHYRQRILDFERRQLRLRY